MFIFFVAYDSRRIDLLSRRTQCRSKGISLIGNEIFVEMDNDTVLIFNQNNLMFNRVETS
jgi:hypothetical protein